MAVETAMDRGYLPQVVGAVLFIGSLLLYLATASGSLGFDDAAEFAYCARNWSVAHPPGFASYTVLAHFWQAAWPRADTASALSALSAVLAATANLLVFLSTWRVLCALCAATATAAVRLGATFLAACGAAVGATCWAWANAPEVYALQSMCTALMFWGVAHPKGGWAVSLGIGLGLANHHVATLLVMLVLPGMARAVHGGGCGAAVRRLLPVAGAGMLLAIGFLAGMGWRATGQYAFEFGNPDSWSRMWHHLSGGFFADSVARSDVDYAGRGLALLEVVLRHYGPLVLALAAGSYALWRRGRATMVLGLLPLGVLWLFQWSRSHTANMDATLAPVLLLSVPVVARGLVALLSRPLGAWVAAVGVVVMFVLNWPAAVRSGYDPGEGLMQDLDRSMPPRAVALLTNWEWRTLFLERRDRDGFRSDVVVVHSALKGANHESIAVAYPDFHAEVRAEYDAFLAAVAVVDPDYVFTDYYRLEGAQLIAAYRAMIRKVLDVAGQAGRPVLCDWQTARLLTELEVLPQSELHAYGNLFSLGRLPDAPAFSVSGSWLGHPFLMHDYCAMATLSNYRSTARQMAGYYRFHGMQEQQQATEAAADLLDQTWRRYAAGMPAPRRAAKAQ
jgi:hypothetical protein